MVQEIEGQDVVLVTGIQRSGKTTLLCSLLNGPDSLQYGGKMIKKDGKIKVVQIIEAL